MLSMKNAGLVSGNPGVSASSEGSLHFCRVIPARRPDHDIVGGAFAGAVEPADQQVAVGQLDDRGRMVVPLLQRKDQLGCYLRRGPRAGGEQDRCQKETLVALLLVDNIDEWASIGEPLDILLDGSDHAIAILIRAAGDVRSDQRVIELP